ncbi:MAG: cyclic nucleotide-binding domain-containing protein [Pseudomonadota bacterium]
MKSKKTSLQKQLFRKFGRSFSKGSFLFRESEFGKEMYIIQSGKVKITKKAGSSDKTLAILSSGDFLGEMAVLTDGPRSATAEAIEDSEILVINPETFEALIQSNSDIAMKILRTLAERLKEANRQIEVLSSNE